PPEPRFQAGGGGQRRGACAGGTGRGGGAERTGAGGAEEGGGMKLGVLLALALWGLSPGTAFACSVRQEALAEFTPQPPDPSLEIIRAQIVLQEVDIARSDPEARRGWYGIKATVLQAEDRKSTRLNSSHVKISYAVLCLKKKKKNRKT